MKQGTFTDEQIVAVLAEAEKGDKTITALCKERAITEQTFYPVFRRENLCWRNKFAGVRTGQRDANKRRSAASGVRKGKLSPQASACRARFGDRHRQRVPSKKLVGTPAKRQFVRYATVKGSSERRACFWANLPRSTHRYISRGNGDSALQECLQRDAAKYPRFGYRRLHAMAKRAGHVVNHKRVYRLCKEQGLSVRRRTKRKSTLPKQERPNKAEQMNHVWTQENRRADFSASILFRISWYRAGKCGC